MLPRTVAISVALSTLATLCVQGCASNTIVPGSQGVTTRESMIVAGIKRTYLLHIHAHYDTIRRAPLVSGQHGQGESAENFKKYSVMCKKANAEVLIALHSQALADPSDWQ